MRSDFVEPPARMDEMTALRAPELAMYGQPHWYAIYTCANREKRVADQIAHRGFDHFLPQYESVRKWKDRKVRLQLPLFPGYLFVQLALRDRLRILEVPGVVRLVGFDGRPSPVPTLEVLRIREFLDRGFRAEPYPYLKIGRRVRIVRGPFEGMEGIVVRKKNCYRFVISLDLIMRSVATELDAVDLESTK
jgi:transcription antitermination factor NusG